MKLTFPDRDLNLHMEGGYCVMKDGVQELFCRLTAVNDNKEGILYDVVNDKHIPVNNVFAENIDWSWPTLGMRNIGAAAVYISRTPAHQYRRTIRNSNTSIEVITPNGRASTNSPGLDKNTMFSVNSVTELFRPSYPDSLRHVRWALNSGKAISMAISPELAVTTVDDDRIFDLVLVYKKLAVGTISAETFALSIYHDLLDTKVGTRADKLYQEWRFEHETTNNSR